MKRIASLVFASFIAAQFLGCATVVDTHYIKSAKVSSSEMPHLVGVNMAEDSGTTIAFSGRYTRKDKLVTTSDTADRVHAFPDNYAIDWNRSDMGLNLKYAPAKAFDIVLAYNTRLADPLREGVGTFGIAVTFPFPWLGIRISPALSYAYFKIDVVDSIHQAFLFNDIDGNPDSSVSDFVERSNESHTEVAGTIAFTAWLPSSLIKTPIVPYVGFQTSARDIIAENIKGEAFYFTDSQFDLGILWRITRAYRLNGILSRNEKFNDANSLTYYRGSIGLEYFFED